MTCRACEPRPALRNARFSVLTAALALLPVLPVHGQVGPPWQNLGPAPIGGVEYTGRISAIACSRNDSNRVFVGGADGGLWCTTNGGTSWTPLTDAMPTSAIGAIAIDPANENTVYVGTGEANFAYHSRFGLGIYRSTDGGNSWSHLAEATFGGRCISRIVINPQFTNVLFAGVTPAGGFIPPQAAAKGHPLANGPVGVFRSVDAGQTWTQLAGGLPALAATDLAMRPGNPQVLYAGIGHIFGNAANGVYKSTDGGLNWVKRAGGLPTTDVGRIALAIAPSMPQRLFAAIARAADAGGGSASLRGVWRSDDEGGSWTALSVSNYMATYGWYLNVVTVQPTNPNVVFLGGLNLLRSTNGGTSWSDVTPPHVDQHALEWDAAGRLLAGDDGGVHRSANLGTSWSPLNTGLGVIQFYAGLSTDPVAPELLYGGTQDNGTNKRQLNGTWTNVFGGDGGVTAVDQNNASIVFCEFQGSGNLYRSANAGASFNFSGTGINASDRNCFLPPYEFDPLNSARLFYATHRVYRSVNGGLNWSAVSPDLTSGGSAAIHSLAVAPSNGQTIYVTTSDGNVQVSFNDGASWQLVRQGLPGWFRVMRQVTVAADDHLTAYLAGSRFAADNVLRTTDGGQSWDVLDGDLPDQPVNVIAVDARPATDVLYAGLEAGVYRTLDGGLHWHRFGPGLPNTPVIDLRLDLPRGRLIAATQGRGAWQIEIWLPGDLNADDVVTDADLPPFVDVLLGLNTDPQAVWRSDLNGDGNPDGDDIAPFLAALPN